eukprot:991873-Amphidinium_carterae.2
MSARFHLPVDVQSLVLELWVHLPSWESCFERTLILEGDSLLRFTTCCSSRKLPSLSSSALILSRHALKCDSVTCTPRTT